MGMDARDRPDRAVPRRSLLLAMHAQHLPALKPNLTLPARRSHTFHIGSQFLPPNRPLLVQATKQALRRERSAEEYQHHVPVLLVGVYDR